MGHARPSFAFAFTCSSASPLEYDELAAIPARRESRRAKSDPDDEDPVLVALARDEHGIVLRGVPSNHVGRARADRGTDLEALVRELIEERERSGFPVASVYMPLGFPFQGSAAFGESSVSVVCPTTVNVLYPVNGGCESCGIFGTPGPNCGPLAAGSFFA